jgi:hypothetical protein
LRYYQMRPRGPGEAPRGIFTPEGTVTRDEAWRRIEGHQPEGRFLVHRIVLAPSDGERPEDLRAMTRQVMRELGKDKGMELHWVGIEHRHTEHHHVHVLLCGGGDAPDGRTREVRLGRGDYQRMREEGAEFCRWEREEREAWDRELELAGAGDREPGRQPAGETRTPGEDARELDRGDR